METNILAFPISAAVVLLTGFIWYNPKVFGTIWMKENGFTTEQLRSGNMLKIFGFTYLFALMLTMVLFALTVHQNGAYGMIGGNAFIETAKPSFTAFMADYGTAFRTYKHGALHGFIAGLFFALPVIGINGLFERKSWKYIFIHTGYWTLTMTFMGAIICGMI